MLRRFEGSKKKAREKKYKEQHRHIGTASDTAPCTGKHMDAQSKLIVAALEKNLEKQLLKLVESN